MAKVLKNNDQVAHAWANAKQPCGYTSSRSFSFDGSALLSYNTVIAQRVSTPAGTQYIYSARSYSVTTEGKHKNAMHKAASHLMDIKVDEAPSNWDLRFSNAFLTWVENQSAYLVDELNKFPGKIKRARSSKAWLVEQYDREAANARRFKTFCIARIDDIEGEWPISAQNRFYAAMDSITEATPSSDTIDTLHLEAGAYLSNQKERQIKTEAEQVEEWKRGKRKKLNIYHTTHLRINKNHDVETSKGMIIPNREARIAFEAFKRGKLLGLKLLGYTITQVNTETKRVVAGCHSVPFEDIEQLGPQLVLLMSA